MARQRPRAGPQMALPHFRPFSPTPHKSVRPCLRPSALSNAREIHLTMSLIGLQREFLLRTLRELQAPGLLYILVLDDTTEALLNRVLPKEKLLRVVTSVDKIDNKRRTQTFLEAIYFVELTPYNLNCIVADVQVHRYKAGHGMFLPVLPTDSDAKHLYNSSRFLQNPKVHDYFGAGQSLHTVPAALYPVESRVFLADPSTPNAMAIYYNDNCAELVLPQIRIAARTLVSLLVVTGEYPLIRFYCPQDASHVAARLPELLADEVQRQLDDYAREHHEYPPAENQDRPRSVLLITDRTMDLYAPLLHEFSYQAMAMDIVPSLERDGVYRYTTQNEAGDDVELEARLDDEDDDDWVSLRHTHIIESSELILTKINDLIRNNPMMVDRLRATTPLDLMWVVAHLQGFDRERRQITLHKKLIDECLDRNADRKLAEFAADFEQTCAAGGTSFEGVRNKTLHDDLVVLLARADLHVNDKMRLVLIYALYRGGLVEADFVKLAKFIGVKDRQMVSLVQRCFTNMHKLGFPIVKLDVSQKRVVREHFHTINNEGTYNTSRFGPGLKAVLQKAARYQLDETWFPYFRDKPLDDDLPADAASSPAGPGSASLRNPRIKASWAQHSAKLGHQNRPKQRIFCYVAGGITYSEVRLVYELADASNKDFFVGSEVILKPRDFLIGLQSVDKAKQIPDLDLPLYHRLQRPAEAPLHLFEVPRAPAPPAATPSTMPHMAGLSVHGSPQPPQPPQQATSLPSHYQTRLSRQQEPEQKDKKKSKLKKLFR